MRTITQALIAAPTATTLVLSGFTAAFAIESHADLAPAGKTSSALEVTTGPGVNQGLYGPYERGSDQDVVDAVNFLNDLRHESVLPELTYNVNLSKPTQPVADMMGAEGARFGHPSAPTGMPVGGVYRGQAHYVYYPQHEAWGGSYEFDALIDDPRITHIGIGVTNAGPDDDGLLTRYVVIDFWEYPTAVTVPGSYHNPADAFTRTPITPSPARFTDSSGGDSDFYTIPATTGVQYYVNGVARAAGTYKASGTVTVTAKAKSGYALTGTSSWQKTFSKNVAVTPTAATFTDKSGTAYDTYTVPAKAGVQYYVNGVAKAAGTYKGAGTVTVTAKAKSGYALTGTTSWKRTFSKNVVVTPTAATFTDKSGTAYDRYTIPAQTGVQYYVNGIAKAAGTYKATGTITVTAKAKTGYALTGTTSWKRTFTKNVVVTATAPTFADKSGTAYDRYTIPAQTGVQYYVNGIAKTAGTYKATGTVTVTARAKTGYSLSGTTTWKRTFSR